MERSRKATNSSSVFQHLWWQIHPLGYCVRPEEWGSLPACLANRGGECPKAHGAYRGILLGLYRTYCGMPVGLSKVGWKGRDQCSLGRNQHGKREGKWDKRGYSGVCLTILGVCMYIFSANGLSCPFVREGNRIRPLVLLVRACAFCLC